MNDAHPWKLYTPPGIHVRRQCGDVMYVCQYVGRTAITRNVRPLTLKPTLHLYDLLWTCCWCAVLDLVLYKMASADDLGDALLACSSAAIGLVLGLVLGLNLGLGQLCRKVGTGRLCTLCVQARSSH